MPIFDKPLSELQTYTGRNPKPADFDAYWETALADLEAVDPAVDLSPAAFKAPGVECFDLTFTGTGGARIYAKYVRPVGAESCPAVVQFHGYTGDSGDWSSLLAYALGGCCIAALDCRGQAGKSQDVGGVLGNTHHGHIIRGLDDPDPQQLLFRHIYLDTTRLVRVVMNLPEVNGSHVGAMGGSQGGGLTLACAGLTPGLNRCAATYPFLCDYLRVWEMDLAKDAYREVRDFFRNFDPTHIREEAIWTKLGYIDCQFLAERIQAKVLWGTGLMDQICPPSSQFAAYNKVTAEKEMVIYPDFGHERLPRFNDRVHAFMMEMRD